MGPEKARLAGTFPVAPELRGPWMLGDTGTVARTAIESCDSFFASTTTVGTCVNFAFSTTPRATVIYDTHRTFTVTHGAGFFWHRSLFFCLQSGYLGFPR